MSREPGTPDAVELTWRAIDASRRGDYQALMELFAPAVVWESLDGLGVFAGAQAVRGFLEDFPSAYAAFDSRPHEILDMGGGIVFVVIHHTGRLPGAAGRVEQRFAWVVAFEEGLVVRVLAGRDIEVARSAAERLAKPPRP